MSDQSLVERLKLGHILKPDTGYDLLHLQMQAREIASAAMLHPVLALEIFGKEAENLGPEFQKDLALLRKVFGEVWRLCQAYAQHHVRVVPQGVPLWEVSSETLNNEDAQRIAQLLQQTPIDRKTFFIELQELIGHLSEDIDYLEVSRSHFQAQISR